MSGRHERRTSPTGARPRRAAGLAVAGALVALVAAGAARGAEDGVIALDGNASAGSAEVTIARRVSVQISRVDDLVFAPRARLDETLVGRDEVCVFSSNLPYLVGASSAGGAVPVLTGTGTGATIPYTISWNDRELSAPGGGGLIGGLVGGLLGLLGDLLSGPQPGVDGDCQGFGNASYSIAIAPEDFNAAPYDVYTDTLTLSIAPE